MHLVTATRWSGDVSESDEGELRWHSVNDLPALEGLARHQLLFLDRVLVEDDSFYSGIAVYQNDEMVDYRTTAPLATTQT